MNRERTAYFCALTVVLLFVGLVLMTASSSASPGTMATPSTSAAADLWRYGVAGMPDPAGSWVSDMQAMGVRWYQNWQFNPTAGAGGLDFYPMAIPSWRPGDTCSLSGDGAQIAAKIRSGLYPAGTTWLIGNEVGASWSGASQAYSPDDYARRYRACYQLLKGLKPGYDDIAAYGFKVASGGILPSSGPYNGAANGLDWLRAVRSAYQRLYSQAMPVDVYNIHLYTAPNDQGYAFLVQAVTSFRFAMRWEWQDAQKPLIISEIGVRETVSWEASISHLTRAVNYMLSATDASTGYAADGYRLVQRWAWFCPTKPPYADNNYWFYTHLYDGLNNRSPLGDAYAARAIATPTPTPTVTPTPTLYVKRVNAGGEAYTDGQGRTWKPDRAFVAGAFGYIGGSAVTTTAQINGTSDDVLFRSARRWSASALPAYKFTVPNGVYAVRLRFAETEATQAGQRVFDIRLKGVTVLPGFDIYAAAGGSARAIDQVFTVSVLNGILNVQLIKIAGDPMINAIEIQRLQ